MKKYLISVILVLAVMLTLVACGCKHEVWNNATCLAPKTCAECGKTEGEALGHVWLAATCDTPKTCESCGVTEGEAKGHAWVDATCEAPKTCTTCNLTEGEALGHAWEDATTEAPKTCTTCGLTEGEKIDTDPRFTTASTKDLQGVWVMDVKATGEILAIPDFTGTLDLQFVIEFGNDGTMLMYTRIGDEQAFIESMIAYTMEVTYAEMEAAGLSREECDAAIQSQYGCTMEEYVRNMMSTMDFNELLSAATVTGVYYVEDGMLYVADFWEQTAVPTEYSVEGDQLTIYEDLMDYGVESTVLTRATEEEI